MVLTVAGRVVPDPMEIWQDYARRTRTLHGYDLAGTGDPAILTASEVKRTRIIASRISRKECVRLVNRAAEAPWAFVAVDADLADADPSQRGGLFDQAAALYWHFTTPHEAGLGPAKIHKVLHLKRPSVYPVLDRLIRRLYRAQARAWVSQLPDVRPGDTVTFWAATTTQSCRCIARRCGRRRASRLWLIFLPSGCSTSSHGRPPEESSADRPRR